MKYLSLLAFSVLLVSCSSQGPVTAPKVTHHFKRTWIEVVRSGKVDARKPASVKDTELREFKQALNTYTGWKTLPIGKAIVTEQVYGDETVSAVEFPLSQNPSGYFILTSYSHGWELTSKFFEANVDRLVNDLKKTATAIKKTGPSTFSMSVNLDYGGSVINCEVKMDLQKSPLHHISTCQDGEGRLLSDKKIVATKNVDLNTMKPQLKKIALTVSPPELSDEAVTEITDSEKRDWSHLIK